MSMNGLFKGLGGGESNKFYSRVGLFALIFIAYLWVAPKLIKKPAGTPPRSGSNEEMQQANRTASGMAPEPVGAPGTAPSPPIAAPPAVGAATGAPSLMGGGGGSPLGSSNVLPVGAGAIGQAQQTSSIVGKIGPGSLAGAYSARVFPMAKISYQ